MPRDHKTPLIKKIAKQACITYRVLKSSADVADSQSELILLLTAVRAADLKIAPRKSKPCGGAAGLQSPRSPTCTSARRRYQHGGVPAEARRLHTAARPTGHERESTELLIRKLPFQRIQLARRIRGHRA
ncbi:unnamed protein product [Pleuronectes platessa]|uniref:Uncharacterized protein n=1 Tax=Pleuronectes platessa TaxID=8262 RepID=A0A9N7UTB4_PLEPL|nr:unnamed protein product [Pleuronectes platessa]